MKKKILKLDEQETNCLQELTETICDVNNNPIENIRLLLDISNKCDTKENKLITDIILLISVCTFNQNQIIDIHSQLISEY